MQEEMLGLGTPMVVGGETVSAKEDYLRVISNLFYKMNGAADMRQNEKDLEWIVNFYTDMLISSVLDPTDRDNLAIAKEDIYQAECLKYATKSIRSVDDIITAVSVEDRARAKIAACTRITGEIRNYLDRYFGFETKLAVML